MSSTLQVLMPMGGLGSRFSKAGYTTPKALIEVDGKPMFMRALDSFKGVPNTQHIFVIRKEHVEMYDLEKQILQQIPSAKIAVLDHDTAGAVETCMIAANLIDDNSPISVADCDIFFQSQTYFDKIAQAEATGSPDGMLLTFEASDPRYSYVELDSAGKAIRTAEKVVISNHAILGGYFFRSGALLKDLAQDFLSTGLPDGLKEYYMSHLFNILLDRSGRIEVADIDVMHIFGTPEELDAYNARSTS